VLDWRKPIAALATGLAVVAALMSANPQGAIPTQRAVRVASASSTPLIYMPSPNLNRDVDDPLASQLDSLSAAVDKMTQ
jgi:hypothetical protein